MQGFLSRRDHELRSSGSREMKSSLGTSGLRGLNSHCDANIWQTSLMTSVETDLCASIIRIARRCVG
jgi:hypothetical protein